MPNTRRGPAVSIKRRQLQCEAPQKFQRRGAFDEGCMLPSLKFEAKAARVAHSACTSIFKTIKRHIFVLHVVDWRLDWRICGFVALKKPQAANDAMLAACFARVT